MASGGLQAMRNESNRRKILFHGGSGKLGTALTMTALYGNRQPAQKLGFVPEAGAQRRPVR